MPTRRQTIRQSLLLAFGMALGRLDALEAQGGTLTVDLNQWQSVVFTHKGKRITVPVAEVFAALAEVQPAAVARKLKEETK